MKPANRRSFLKLILGLGGGVVGATFLGSLVSRWINGDFDVPEAGMETVEAVEARGTPSPTGTKTPTNTPEPTATETVVPTATPWFTRELLLRPAETPSEIAVRIPYHPITEHAEFQASLNEVRAYIDEDIMPYVPENRLIDSKKKHISGGAGEGFNIKKGAPLDVVGRVLAKEEVPVLFLPYIDDDKRYCVPHILNKGMDQGEDSWCARSFGTLYEFFQKNDSVVGFISASTGGQVKLRLSIQPFYGNWRRCRIASR